MFDDGASPQVTPAFAGMDDAGVVDVIAAAAHEQNAMCGREMAAIGELYARRAPEDDDDRINWAIDGHENVVAEVAAALSISRGRARGRLRYAIALRERLTCSTKSAWTWCGRTTCDSTGQRIETAVGLAERDPEIKVIVLRGAGRAFCAGYDFGDGLLNNGTRNGTLTIDIDNRTLRAEP